MLSSVRLEYVTRCTIDALHSKSSSAAVSSASDLPVHLYTTASFVMVAVVVLVVVVKDVFVAVTLVNVKVVDDVDGSGVGSSTGSGIGSPTGSSS